MRETCGNAGYPTARPKGTHLNRSVFRSRCSVAKLAVRICTPRQNGSIRLSSQTERTARDDRDDSATHTKAAHLNRSGFLRRGSVAQLSIGVQAPSQKRAV